MMHPESDDSIVVVSDVYLLKAYGERRHTSTLS
jgi:hypothetical protein